VCKAALQLLLLLIPANFPAPAAPEKLPYCCCQEQQQQQRQGRQA
jgi:hypothetical protein